LRSRLLRANRQQKERSNQDDKKGRSHC
jgi:hypothetical protein